MRLFLLRVLALAAAVGGGGAHAFDWDYSAVRFELSQEAVTSASAYRAWAAAPRRSLAEMAAAIAPSGRVKLSRTSTVRQDGVEKTTFDFVLEGFADAPLPYSVVQWRPAKARAALPVVAFDGHGDCGGECSGAAPKRMFAQGGFAADLVKRGYTVLGFPTAIHKPFERQAKTVDYPVLWAAVAHRVMQKHAFAALPQGRYVAVGSAIGGLTALSLAVIDDRAAATATNGSFFPLELTRREYRIKDHAFCHDYRAFNTYTSVYALLAPRPLMVQMGRKDALWLGHGAAAPSSWFSGMKRGATVDETLGAAYVLERLWRTQAASFELVVHPGEHETVDVGRLDAFLRKVPAR